MSLLYILGPLVVAVVVYSLYARKRPQAMRVQLVLLEGDKPVLQDTLVLVDEGETRTYEVGGSVYTLRASFDLPMSTISIVAPTYEAATMIGVHQSEGWEAIAVGHHAVLRYKCSPLFQQKKTRRG